MRSGLGGFETLNLYAEAIAKMPENPGIPLLFRDIFKNAYLPYRDPETLRAFLKIIDEFNYDHSERLGDGDDFVFRLESLVEVGGTAGDDLLDHALVVLDAEQRADAYQRQAHLDTEVLEGFRGEVAGMRIVQAGE